MWGTALKTIPQITKEEFNKEDPIAQWLIASRAALFIMDFFSASVGGLLAASVHRFSWPVYLLCVLGFVLAHGTNNLINDYTDSSRGVDKDNYFRNIYGLQLVEMGIWSKAKMRKVIGISGLLALLCGFVLFLMCGPSVLWLTALGAFFVLFYTWPLKYIGLGEFTVLLVWGPLMVAGTYLLMTGNWSWMVAAIGAVYALGGTSILFGKHTDKLTEDKKKGIHTLPVILGEPAARASVIAMLVSVPIFIIWFVIIGWLQFPMLLVLLGIPSILKTIRIFSKPRPKTQPKGAPWPTYLSSYAFLCNRVIGSLFMLGLVLSLFVD